VVDPEVERAMTAGWYARAAAAAAADAAAAARWRLIIDFFVLHLGFFYWRPISLFVSAAPV